MKVHSETPEGGAVTFNASEGVWASYRVAGVEGMPTVPLFYGGVGLPDGRVVHLFVNRDTGLIVVDVLDADGRGGNEILRVHARNVVPSRPPRKPRVPKSWPVQPLKANQRATDRVTCGTCGLSWDDAKVTSVTPAPSGRCPFEPLHADSASTEGNV